DRKRTVFNLKLAPKGTPFQKKVWAELLKIPYGKTVSYQDIAVSIGNPDACRAVGMANNKNPIPIFIPCHRVIGKNGNLTGYAGGLDCKQALLEIENISQ
ncbi:MAG: methylated-DNA--[protein]-cysteine S-methyltransferase, partial [bacterium]|nr:methylated-DNA--[protein]-cysteine S-methyltransferase [bacterium]